MSKQTTKTRTRTVRKRKPNNQLGGAAAGATIGGMAAGPGGALIGGLLGAIFFGDSETPSGRKSKKSAYKSAKTKKK